MSCRYSYAIAIFLGIMLSASHSLAQRIHIIDENSEPILGVSVHVDGTSSQLRSDKSGIVVLTDEFNGKRLFFRHVSYMHKDTILTGSRDENVYVQLRATNNLIEEVPIYTGYQQLSVREQVGSVDALGEKAIAQRLAPQILDRLDGMLSGVTFDRGQSQENANSNMRIRGLSSINGNQAPLIILDDFPYEGELSNISPDNIANITVLKDAAAASIWGARAGNGVIVITSKKAVLERKVNVGFQSSFTMSSMPNLRYASTMTPAEFVEVERELFTLGYYDDALVAFNKPGVTPVVALLDRHRKQQLNDSELERQLGALAAHDLYDDLEKYVYSRQAVNQQRLSVAGGTSNYGYNLSLSHNRTESELSAIGERLVLQSDQLFQLTKWMRFQLGTSITDRHNKSGKQGLANFSNSAGQIVPYARLGDENGNAVPLVRNLNMDYLGGLQETDLLDWYYYPLEDYKHQVLTDHVRELMLNPSLQIKLPLGFEFQSQYSYQNQTIDRLSDYGAESYYTRDLINKFSKIEADGTLTRRIPLGAIRRGSLDRLSVHNVRNLFRYDRSFQNIHLNGLAGMEVRNAVAEGSGYIRYGFNQDRYTNSLVDPTVPYPNFVTGYGDYIPFSDGETKRTNRFVSYFGNVTANISQKYYLMGSFRKDASNFFGVNTNRRWNPLWSMGAAWDISKESFYDLKWLSYLKVRGSYGLSGNMAYNMVSVTTIRNRNNSNFNRKPVAEIANFENPDLKWETIKTLNLGLDFAVFSDRLSGSIEWYKKKGQDLYGVTPVDYTTGIGNSVLKNVASMEAKGLDLTLNSRNLDGALRWNTALKLSLNKDKVTDYYLANNYGYNFVGGINNVSGVVGKPVYSMLSYQWNGLDPLDGTPQGYLQGEASKDYAAITGIGTSVEDLKYHGSTMPTTFGSFANELQYGPLSLSFSFTFKLGHFLRRSTLEYASLVQMNQTHSDYALRWQQSGDEKITDIPSFTYPINYGMDNFYRNATPFVYDAGLIRLQYINLGYDVPPLKLGNSMLRAHGYINVENPGLLWTKNRLGLDPDAGRQQLGSYPAMRMFSFGVKISL